MGEPESELAFERHFSVAEIAKMWRWSDDKVRKVFRDEPGVLRSQLRAPVTLAIPESVVLRVHRRLRIGS
jgi:hypothetical protein